MNFDFTIVPIAATKDNLNLNDFLVQRRKFLRVRFGDLAARTGIPAKHLQKIEKGEWCDLPSGVYVKGFLKKYAQAVGLDEAELASRYEKEWKQICEVPLSPAKNNILKRVGFLRNISFRWAVIGLAVVLVLGYIGWQFGIIFEKPDLNLNYPAEGDTIVSNSKLEFKGDVSPDAVLTINGETVYPEENGFFIKSVELLSGINIFEIKAVSRFGKENKITRRITYNP